MSTRNVLAKLSGNLQESIGVREFDHKPKLSPVPSERDAGRRPVRNIGTLDISRVVRDPSQPRREFDQDEIDRLARSIGKKQLAPIRVRLGGRSRQMGNRPPASGDLELH